MFRRVCLIDPAAQHCNRTPLRCECASMGCRINPTRKPTYYRHASFRQIAAQLFSHGTPGCRRTPCTYDGHRQFIFLSQCARDVQE